MDMVGRLVEWCHNTLSHEGRDGIQPKRYNKVLVCSSYSPLCYTEIKQTLKPQLQMYKILKRMYGVLGESLLYQHSTDIVFSSGME